MYYTNEKQICVLHVCTMERKRTCTFSIRLDMLGTCLSQLRGIGSHDPLTSSRK